MSDQHSFSDYLDNIKETINESSDGAREAAIKEGLLNLKGSIKGIDTEPSKEKKTSEKKYSEPKFSKLDIANRALDTYKTKIGPKTVDNRQPLESESKEVINTKASREQIKATMRALAGGRTVSDNPGKPVDMSGASNQKFDNSGRDDYYANVSSMTLEDYKQKIYGSFGLLDEEVEEEIVEEIVENENEVDVISMLQEALIESGAQDWMEVDQVTRSVCEECNILPKELNREFRRVVGQYPDKWIKEQVEVETCGYFPLEEATRLMKVGDLYDVTFAWRGGTERFQFFWPEPSRPTFEEMQGAVEKFYPRARLLSFYLARHQDHNSMVIIPPLSESYEIMEESDWLILSEEDSEVYASICEEVGEPIHTPELQEDGTYLVTVSDHDTGEEREVVFGEMLGGLLKKDPAKVRARKVAEAERLAKHLSDDKSDVSKKYIVKKKEVTEGAAWTRKEGQNSAGGLNETARKSYERENPGSDLKRPQPEGGKRRTSYCKRSAGQQKMHNIDCSKDPDKRICKARRKWKC